MSIEIAYDSVLPRVEKHYNGKLQNGFLLPCRQRVCHNEYVISENLS